MARQTIGEFLQTLRRANGYTQQEVADKLGISNKTLSSWETDRAYPDLLSIPALADLYSVTADEILRGERSSANSRGEENKENEDKISDKCERAALKNRYLKFNTQSYALLIPACAAAVLIIPAMFVSATAGVILLILAAIALVTTVVLQTVFYKNALISADIVDGTQLSPAQTDYIRDIKNTLYRCIKIDGMAFLAASIILFAAGVFSIADNSSVSAIYYLTVLAAAICAVAALVIAEKHTKNKSSGNKPSKQYTKQQQAILKKNYKLRVKCVIAAVIACAVISMACGILLNVPFSKSEEVYGGTAEQIKHYLQTLVVETDSTLHNECDVPAAAYYIDLPDAYADDFDPHDTYYFDNGFTGCFSYDSDSWQIMYPVGDENYSINYVVSDAQIIEIGDITAYNVRYGAKHVTDNSIKGTSVGEGIYFLEPTYYIEVTYEGIYYSDYDYFVEVSGAYPDSYVLKMESTLYIYDGYVVLGGAALAIVAIIIPTIIYLSRRKKIA